MSIENKCHGSKQQQNCTNLLQWIIVQELMKVTFISGELVRNLTILFYIWITTVEKKVNNELFG